MLDLEHELAALIDALNREGIDYALCGGLALAVHGFVRASVDLDLLVREVDLSRLDATATTLEFHHFIKTDVDGDRVNIDPHVVNGQTESVWRDRELRAWDGRNLSVVSRSGLVMLKTLRGRGQDLADVERLEDTDYSERAVTVRLIRVSQLRKLCLSLGKAKSAKPAAPPRD